MTGAGKPGMSLLAARQRLVRLVPTSSATCLNGTKSSLRFIAAALGMAPCQAIPTPLPPVALMNPSRNGKDLLNQIPSLAAKRWRRRA